MFSKKPFLKGLKLGFINHCIFNYFNNGFQEILDLCALLKQTKLCGNTKPFVDKILRNEMMKRSRLKNKTNKTCSKDDLKLYSSKNLKLKS